MHLTSNGQGLEFAGAADSRERGDEPDTGKTLVTPWRDPSAVTGVRQGHGVSRRTQRRMSVRAGTLKATDHKPSSPLACGRRTAMLTTTYAPGAPNWLDLGSPDVEAAAAFYGALWLGVADHGTGSRRVRLLAAERENRRRDRPAHRGGRGLRLDAVFPHRRRRRHHQRRRAGRRHRPCPAHGRLLGRPDGGVHRPDRAPNSPPGSPATRRAWKRSTM